MTPTREPYRLRCQGRGRAYRESREGRVWLGCQQVVVAATRATAKVNASRRGWRVDGAILCRMCRGHLPL